MVLFISFPTHLYSSLVMDRQGISPSVYNNDEFDATKNNSDAKMQAQMEEIKALIKSYKRSSSSLRRRSRAHASELPSPARSHWHRHHHHHEREGDAEHPTFIPMYTPTSLQGPRIHKMRPRLYTIGHKVNSLLFEPSLFIRETWLLPKHVCYA